MKSFGKKCVCILIAGLFAVGWFFALGTDGERQSGFVIASALPLDITSIKYYDNLTETEKTVAYNSNLEKNFIKYYGDFGALYNTTGFLNISLADEASNNLNDIQVLGKVVDGEGESGINIYDTYDSEFDRYVIYWDYDKVGVYEISVSILICKTVSQTQESQDDENDENSENDENDGSGENNDGDEESDNSSDNQDESTGHESNGEVEEEQSQPSDAEDNEEIIETLDFVFYSVCKSSEPKLSVRYTINGQTYNENFSPYSNLKNTIRVTVESDNNFYCKQVVYESNCEFLFASDDGKYLVLESLKPGLYLLDFKIIFEFTEVVVGDDGGINVKSVQKTETVVSEISILSAPKGSTFLDVLFGVFVLSFLGGAIMLMTKFSRQVQHN